MCSGQYTDPETGLIYLRARYYDPATGQFLTRDPIEAITREAYGYVGGNPLNRTDPLGLIGIPEWVPVVGGKCVDILDPDCDSPADDLCLTVNDGCESLVSSATGGEVCSRFSDENCAPREGSVVATACPFYGCVGVSLDLASLDVDGHYGLGVAVGAGANFYPDSAPTGGRDEWFASAVNVTVGQTRSNADVCEPGAWDAFGGIGYGLQFGGGLLHWYR